jgi:hypothetical protein
MDVLVVPSPPTCSDGVLLDVPTLAVNWMTLARTNSSMAKLSFIAAGAAWPQ